MQLVAKNKDLAVGFMGDEAELAAVVLMALIVVAAIAVVLQAVLMS